MLLRFWGTRGSLPAPIHPNQIEYKILTALELAHEQKINLADARARRKFVKDLSLEASTVGGNTTCLTLQLGEHLIIFDAGSGMRELGDYLMTGSDDWAQRAGFRHGKGHAYIFFTHTHWDHIQGLPFFKPLHVPGNTFDIYHVHEHVPHSLARQMEAAFFPLQFDRIGSTLNFHQLHEGEQVKVAGAVISNIDLKHPGKAYAYRVEADNATVILATDGEYQSLDNTDTLKYRNFYANADVLIFDAMFSVRESFVKEDWGHSSALIGADIAAESHVKRLLLFHHDPHSTDTEILQILRETEEYIEAQGSALEVLIAHEGLELHVENVTISSDFHLKDRVEGGVVFISLIGKFGGQATQRFRKHLAHTLQTHKTDKVILNLANLKDLQMAGIRALVDARRTVTSLALVAVPENIYRVIELSGTTDFFAIYDDDESALAALNSR
jgi:anti-anti-sigma factor